MKGEGEMSVRTQKMIVPSNCSLKDCASRSLPRAEARCAHPAGYDSPPSAAEDKFSQKSYAPHIPKNRYRTPFRRKSPFDTKNHTEIVAVSIFCTTFGTSDPLKET